MRNRTFADLDRVVALGGGHGLGRVMSSLSSLGSRLTGIVTTTDNGGSTGRIRRSEGGIAWGDMRNCINQLIAEPSVASAMFEYRFGGNGELSGHNLGNLMLKALDHLSVRPLEAINLIRNLLKVDAFLIPMSEQPVDLMALDHEGHEVYGEVNIDQLDNVPQELMLTPPVPATREAVYAIYYDQLRRKVEDKGTANFPELGGHKLYGELTMVLTINHDGRLLSTEIRESSGNRTLDRRAEAIAQGAAPFGKFNDEMRQKADQIAVVSRFRFTRDETLQTRQLANQP